MAGKHSELTAKQSAFVIEYLSNGRVGVDAYRAAYDTNASPQQVTDEASKMLRHPKIAPIIAEAEARGAAAVARAVDKYELTQEQCAEKLIALATYDVRDVFEWGERGVVLKPSAELSDQAAFAVSEIRQGQFGVTVKMADKRAALMDIARLRGWLVDRNQQLGADGKPVDPGRPMILFNVLGKQVDERT